MLRAIEKLSRRLHRQEVQPSVQVLLAEYQACENSVGTNAFQGWQPVAIIYGAAFAGAVFLITAEKGLATSIATTGAAVLAVALIEGARRTVLRATSSINHAWQRMRDIEWILNMRKNIYLSILADWRHRASNPNWHRLNRQEQVALEIDYARREPGMAGPRATPLLSMTAHGLQVSWLLLAAWRWLEYKSVIV